MLGNGPVRFGGRPHGKGPAQRAPRRAAHPVRKREHQRIDVSSDDGHRVGDAHDKRDGRPGRRLVGAGCKAYAEQVPSGPGSVAGMSQDPVAVAASNNPMLKTLTSALSGKLNPNVNLVDMLNSGEYTVFALTDDAFAKIDSATTEKLKTDSDLLTKILTYHVVSGQASPAQVVGQHKTLQGGTVTVTGSGEALNINDAGLVCGGVRTANATVYMIDTVLMPPAA